MHVIRRFSYRYFTICRYCEVSAVRLIEEQSRSVEQKLLVKEFDLNHLIFDESINLIDDLIDDLIALIFFVIVENFSTWISSLIWMTSASIMYFCLNALSIRWIFKFDIALIAICEVLAIWLIEKRIRNVEQEQLIKWLDLNESIDVKFDWSTNLK